jgi:hypothetical protein
VASGRDTGRASDVRRGNREVLVAAALQGAIFALVQAALDRGLAEATRKLTGSWPGEGAEQDEPEYTSAPRVAVVDQQLQPGGDDPRLGRRKG